MIGPSFSRCFLRPGSCEETGLSTDERRLHGGHHGGHVGGLGPGGSAVDQRHGWQHHSNVWQLGQPCCRPAPPPNHFVVLFFGHGESYHFWVWLLWLWLWLWWLWLWWLWLWWLFKAPQTRTRSRSHVFCL